MNLDQKTQIGKTKKYRRAISSEPVSELSDSLHASYHWWLKFEWMTNMRFSFKKAALSQDEFLISIHIIILYILVPA